MKDFGFELLYCINLPHRLEKFEQVKLQFEQHNIAGLQRFVAIDGDKVDIPDNWQGSRGAYGCLLSHLAVVKQAKQLNANNVVIFEDDVALDSHFKQKLAKVMAELPTHWDMLFFGAIQLEDPVIVSDNLTRMSKAYTTFGYVIHQRVFDAFIALNQQATSAVDINQFELFQQFNCYCCSPHIAWVDNSYSDTEHKQANHWYIRESLQIFGKIMDQRLKQTCVVLLVEQGCDWSILNFTLNYYHEYFQANINICLYEIAKQSQIPSQLIAKCHHHFVSGNDTLRPIDAYGAAADKLMAKSSYQNLVLATVGLYIEAMDFRANLLCCQQYVACIGYQKCVELNCQMTVQLINNGHAKGININELTQCESDLYYHFVTVNQLFALINGLKGIDTDCINLNQEDTFVSPNVGLILNRSY